MPSYRVTATIGDLRVGANPEQVLPAAADAARERTTVEAWDVAVVRGEARITVRFMADDDVAALAIAQHVAVQTNKVAQVTGRKVTRRYGGRWYVVRPGGPPPSIHRARA